VELGFPKSGGPRYFSRVELLNHQTSKNSIMLFWMKSSLWVFKIQRFEGGIGVPKHGGPRNSTRVEFLNHQTLKNSIMSFWMKLSLRVIKIRGFQGGVGFQKTWETP
jgi:hypothetical protein